MRELEKSFNDQSEEVIKIMTNYKVRMETADSRVMDDELKREMDKAMQRDIDKVKSEYEKRRQLLMNNIKDQFR